jgi:hypothetical protein
MLQQRLRKSRTAARPRLKLVLLIAASTLVVDMVTKVIAVDVLVPGQRVP